MTCFNIERYKETRWTCSYCNHANLSFIFSCSNCFKDKDSMNDFYYFKVKEKFLFYLNCLTFSLLGDEFLICHKCHSKNHLTNCRCSKCHALLEIDRFEKSALSKAQLKVEPHFSNFSRQASAFASSIYVPNSFLETQQATSSFLSMQSVALPSNYINGMNTIKRKNSLKLFKRSESKR